MKPNFNHIDTWVFDLDNTLYPASTNLFAAIDGRMGEFIATLLRVDAIEARRIQKSYFRDYGTTLRGLMINHAIEPDSFLEYVHAIDVGVLAPDPGLQSALGQLEGRKIIFTNGSSSHAEKVMTRLGVVDHFEAIFDVADADYLSKPDPAAYRALIARHRLSPRATTLFEDLSRNLAPAAELGMTTVWVKNRTAWAESAEGLESRPDYVHHETENLVSWLEDVVEARHSDPSTGR